MGVEKKIIHVSGIFQPKSTIHYGVYGIPHVYGNTADISYLGPSPVDITYTHSTHVTIQYLYIYIIGHVIHIYICYIHKTYTSYTHYTPITYIPRTYGNPTENLQRLFWQTACRSWIHCSQQLDLASWTGDRSGTTDVAGHWMGTLGWSRSVPWTIQKIIGLLQLPHDLTHMITHIWWFSPQKWGFHYLSLTNWASQTKTIKPEESTI